jgi:hypothetical protein
MWEMISNMGKKGREEYFCWDKIRGSKKLRLLWV